MAMVTAFGRAIWDSLRGDSQRFRMTMLGGPSIEMDCRDFIDTRGDEIELLNRIDLPEHGAVLDWGCGPGRHLAYIRQRHPSVCCCGIDICDLLLDHCRRTIPAPAEFAKAFEDLQPRKFNLVMLMGNGLGVLGGEGDAIARLRLLVDSLAEGGQIVVETGNPFGNGYVTPEFTVEYGGHRDGPFPWGYADRSWIFRTFQTLGLSARIFPSRARGGMFFFAVGQRDGGAC